MRAWQISVIVALSIIACAMYGPPFFHLFQQLRREDRERRSLGDNE